MEKKTRFEQVFNELNPNHLVGSFFHSYDEKEEVLNWQGCVVAKVASEVYLIEHFSFLTGERTHQRLVKLEDMFHWHFFDTIEDMNDAYDEYSRNKYGNNGWGVSTNEINKMRGAPTTDEALESI